jgi:hypothetical protein
MALTEASICAPILARSAWSVSVRSCASQLVDHAVQIRREAAQLVPVGDVDLPGEIARRELVESRLHLLDRPDQR